MERKIWIPETNALTLLDTLGSPFSTSVFRAAAVATLPGFRDLSFGAQAFDGTFAAVALLAREHDAESMPPAGYGGIVASRALDPAEIRSFVKLASLTLPVRRLRLRSLELEGTPPIGRRFAMASVVPVDRERPPSAGYARLARRSVKRAAASGATVRVCNSLDAFWPIYEAASRDRGSQYPEPLIKRLIDTGAARVHAVQLGERIVASLLTLVGGSHWMCWLAGQSEQGRSIAASYLAYDAVLAEAQRSGVSAVNLGASVGGGAEFKRHLGASDTAMREWTHESIPAAAGRLARTVTGAALARARARQWRTR